MLQLLYNLLIGPLDLYFETIYILSKDLLTGGGLVVIPMSFAVSFISLPFYRRAEAIQRKERRLEKRMEKGIAHIRKTFNGDERFLMLQAFYRINHYHPVYILKSLLPLALQVPFFISAYRFLSGLEAFKGTAFGPITDLGSPDRLLSVAGISVNLLPVLMTVINCVSSSIYSKDHTVREKVQLYATAGIFLVLLYNSPSGLVLYWTCNNIFSLVRNIIDYSNNRSFVLCAVYSGLSLFFLMAALGSSLIVGEHYIWAYIVSGLFLIPLIRVRLGNRTARWMGGFLSANSVPRFFVMGCAVLTILTGVLIPSSVIKASPAEFVIASAFQTPLVYLADSLAVAAGLFLVWFGFFYYLSSSGARKVMEILVWILCVSGLMNFMLFGRRLGMLNAQLQFESVPAFSDIELLINSAAVLAVAAIGVIVWIKKKQILRFAGPILALSLAVVSLAQIFQIESEMPQIRKATESGAAGENTVQLSRNGKNVVVIMLDSAINEFIPYLMQEKPELEQKLDGFTRYPNTISYGPATNTGVPGVYGGYEYIPEAMNARSDLPLAYKQNEALKLMPLLFDKAGFQVTVCDPPYANYSWIPDLSIYDEYPSIHAFNIGQGQFQGEFTEGQERTMAIWKRNFFCYGIMKASPLLLQPWIYRDGTYFGSARYGEDSSISITDGLSKAAGLSELFLKSYGALNSLPNITQIINNDQGAFFVMDSNVAHDAVLLQEPDYIPSKKVDNTAYDAEHQDRFILGDRVLHVETVEQMEKYHGCMAAMLQLGQWFDYLRKEGIYDNTRIIIVADHGSTLKCFDDMLFGDEVYEDAMRFNPLLMVKDFNSHGFKTDYQFMTNADTPLLAFEGLIKDPVNPFTEKRINDVVKQNPEQHIFWTNIYQTNINNGNTFMPGTWLTLYNHDLFDMANWKVDVG